ncbi:AraC family transcriptional regulator ligand-binding domain-containing protein [Burkholderia plantarii]|uniref:AraC family transcriptional regulator ligand-binding domain-containing protein n=1 Tax=Burkholderia plantarii TaxID=41899 RepID=UPI000A67CDB0|nr:AraC family transcriptional regulator ligand-binding domain-containing protein [Burkholderia plantarii]
MTDDSAVYVGLDVHKESITVAYAIDAGEVESLGKIGTTQTEIDRLCKRLQSKASHVRVVYEAGPCGYRQDLRVFSSLMCVGAGQREILDSTRARVEFIRAEFDFPRPDDHEELRRILACPVVFDAPSTSLSIFRQHPDLELPSHREIAFDIARGEYARQEHTTAEWQPDQGVTRALQTLHRLDGRLDAHGLAAGSNMPLGSTQREFGRAGLGFRSLLDQVRLARALDPLPQAGK